MQPIKKGEVQLLQWEAQTSALSTKKGNKK